MTPFVLADFVTDEDGTTKTVEVWRWGTKTKARINRGYLLQIDGDPEPTLALAEKIAKQVNPSVRPTKPTTLE